MAGYPIGAKIRALRIKNGLTQAELAARCELSKGFISQLESEQTSPSIATLMDILECLGTNLTEFFSDESREKIIFTEEDYFENEVEEAGHKMTWLVPNCQKNDMEPVILEIAPGGEGPEEEPHAGQEFGYVLQGSVKLIMGEAVYRVKKGDSFYYSADLDHKIINTGKTAARLIWVSTPPSF